MDESAIALLDVEALRKWPLPLPSSDSDKEERGRILVVGGSREMPGAVILAATAALRAGAGKLTIATGASVAQLVALAIPESRVIGLPETSERGIAPAAIDALRGLAGKLDAVLVGPGMEDEAAACAFSLALLSELRVGKAVLDAMVMRAVCSTGQHGDAQVLVTPHAGEMAHLTGLTKDEILANPLHVAREAARCWNATVVLKGATTVIATPERRIWRHDGGNAGLAISGSGDTLAGIIAGLAARGASLEQASAWGVALHAGAGERLGARFGPLGFLASELAAEIPGLMHAWRSR